MVNYRYSKHVAPCSLLLLASAHNVQLSCRRQIIHDSTTYNFSRNVCAQSPCGVVPVTVIGWIPPSKPTKPIKPRFFPLRVEYGARLAMDKLASSRNSRQPCARCLHAASRALFFQSQLAAARYGGIKSLPGSPLCRISPGRSEEAAC